MKSDKYYLELIKKTFCCVQGPNLQGRISVKKRRPRLKLASAYAWNILQELRSRCFGGRIGWGIINGQV